MIFGHAFLDAGVTSNNLRYFVYKATHFPKSVTCCSTRVRGSDRGLFNSNNVIASRYPCQCKKNKTKISYPPSAASASSSNGSPLSQLRSGTYIQVNLINGTCISQYLAFSDPPTHSYALHTIGVFNNAEASGGRSAIALAGFGIAGRKYSLLPNGNNVSESWRIQEA